MIVGTNIVLKTPESIEFGQIVNRYKKRGKYVYDVMSERGSVFYGISTDKKINAIYISDSLTKKLSSQLKSIQIKVTDYEKPE